MISTIGFGQTIQGKVIDEGNGGGLPFANVVLEKEGVQKAGTTTDLDGNYILTGFDPGTYSVRVVYVGYQDNLINGIVVGASKTVPLDIGMTVPTDGVDLDVVIVKAYKVPLIEHDNTASGETVTAEEVMKMPVKNVTSVIATTAGVSQGKEGGKTSFRGAREDDDIIFVDGVRTRRSTVPAADIEQVQVITGGLPARYGDVTGGITNIVTRGPSSKFAGNLELETSEFLDAYGYNSANLSFSGPLLNKKDSEGNVLRSIIGYRISGQYRNLREPSPSYVGAYKATDEFLALVKDDPLIFKNGRYIPRGFFITEDEIEMVKARPNVGRMDLNGNAKVDIQPVSGLNFTIGGNYNFIDREDNVRSERTWLLNSHKHLERFDKDWRVYVRLRQKIGGSGLENLTDEEKEERSSSTIQNINYTLQVDYNKINIDRHDPIHKENLFEYGYLGQYERSWTPAYGFNNDSARWEQVGFAESFDNFIPGGVNLAQEKYLGYDIDPATQQIPQNGLMPSSLEYIYSSNMHYNYGATRANWFERIEENQFGITASGGLDIVGKGKDKSKHSILLGVIYEQRVDRSYDIFPAAIWQLGRQLVRSDWYLNTSDTIWNAAGDSISFPLAYNNSSTFANEVRDKYSSEATGHFNTDFLRPEDLDLGMFSADELNDNLPSIYLNYEGYDYTGKKLGSDVSFEDFFTERDARGDLYRPVAPFSPIYTAFFLQDKFTFRDVYFNLGVRVDRYDANTKVLADPYTFNPIKSVAESPELSHADGVGDDWKVYAEEVGGQTVPFAYRDGDTWYTPSGALINDPLAVYGGRNIGGLALYKRYQNIKDEDYDPTGVFVDYEPQINVMPRISFSFPISEDAGFFAHYDILTRRPSERNEMNVLDYYNWVQRQNIYNIQNPDLKPSKTIDYQVGFQQRVSQSSSVKLTAYYREQRDLIAARTYTYADPVPTYVTVGNRDFGTVKGFTFQYDLRRTKNFKFKLDYTLQFAEGTSSSASTSSRGTSQLGSVRPIFPYSFDQRHNIVGRIDFRYDEGDRYNGPKIAGKNILENFGINLLTKFGSGRPYTRKRDPSQLTSSDTGGGLNTIGDFNGSRLPWTNQFDLRVDKDFFFGRKAGKKGISLNVYLRVLNVFNTANIVGVYRYTQDPDNDGFLLSADGQTLLNSAEDANTYETLYNIRLLDDSNYGLPRRMRLGIITNF